ncbi:MAG: transcriptional repressor [Thermodesulfovibrionales bacterium]|nr:transcriptional repressor [Thermodesulfovibrionales bacterium]
MREKPVQKQVFSRFLKERGQRFTKERSAILEKTMSRNGHFDPETLYIEIRKAGAKASRASVYRTISLLCECGLIEQVRKTEHGTVYERSFGHEHHDHMLCIGCGSAIEFYSDKLERLQEDLCRQQGFQGTTHTLEIRGYCRKCQKKKKQT